MKAFKFRLYPTIDQSNQLIGYPKSPADLNVINAHAKCSIAR